MATREELDRVRFEAWDGQDWDESEDESSDYAQEITEEDEDDADTLDSECYDDEEEVKPSTKITYETTAIYDTDDFEPDEYEVEDRSPDDEQQWLDDDYDAAIEESGVDADYYDSSDD